MRKDYCTASPDNLFGYYWGDKCKIHDENYYHQNITKKEADVELREGMKKVLPKYLDWIAWIYYFFVRTFGIFFWTELNFLGGKKK